MWSKYVTVILLGLILIAPETYMVSGGEEEKTRNLNNDNNLIIFYPRSTIPVIVERNNSFNIFFAAPDYEDIAVEISTAYDPIPDTFTLPVIDEKKESGKWRCTVRIPSEIPEELYNLTITIETIDGTYSRATPRSVEVKDEITGNFTFVHLTDFHIGDPRGLKENIRETIGWKAAKKCIEEINLLHPEFVVITGDLVFGQLHPGEYTREYKKCYKILQQFQVPIYLCPGNHDGYLQTGQDGFEYWEKYFGSLYYSFNYGETHFLSINSYDWPKKLRTTFFFIPLNWGGYIQDEQLQWIEEDLDSNIDARLKIMLMHHNPLWDTSHESLMGIHYIGREELLNLIQEYNVDAVFDGHVHYDNITIWNDTLFVTTTTASSSLGAEDAYWGYRLIKVENYSIISYNYKEPKYSIPSYHLNYVSEDEHHKTIKNDLDMDVKIETTFLLPKGTYNVENGEIYMIRERGDLMELYVTAEVPAQSEVTITVH